MKYLENDRFSLELNDLYNVISFDRGFNNWVMFARFEIVINSHSRAFHFAKFWKFKTVSWIFWRVTVPYYLQNFTLIKVKIMSSVSFMTNKLNDQGRTFSSETIVTLLVIILSSTITYLTGKGFICVSYEKCNTKYGTSWYSL